MPETLTMQDPTPSTTTVCVVRNDRVGLENLLRSLEVSRLESLGTWPILIIDSASDVAFRECLKMYPAAFPKLEIEILLRSSNSICEARQQALSFLKTNWVTFLDSDVLVPPAWSRENAEILRRVENQYEVLACAGPTLFDLSASHAAVLRGLSFAFPYHRAISSSKIVNHIPTSYLNVRRARALEIGGFQEDFGNVGEDVLFSARIRENRGTLLLVPAPSVAHRQRGNLPTQLRRYYRYGMVHGRMVGRFQTRPGMRFLPLVALAICCAIGIWRPVFAVQALGALVLFAVAGRRWKVHALFMFIASYGCGSLQGMLLEGRQAFANFRDRGSGPAH